MQEMALIQVSVPILVLVLVGVQSFRLSDLSKRIERVERRLDTFFNSKQKSN